MNRILLTTVFVFSGFYLPSFSAQEERGVIEEVVVSALKVKPSIGIFKAANLLLGTSYFNPVTLWVTALFPAKSVPFLVGGFRWGSTAAAAAAIFSRFPIVVR